MTCRGETSWFGFARAIVGYLANQMPDKKIARCVAIKSSEYPLPARRPSNSVLSNEKLRSGFGIELPEWRAAMERVMEEISAIV